MTLSEKTTMKKRGSISIFLIINPCARLEQSNLQRGKDVHCSGECPDLVCLQGLRDPIFNLQRVMKLSLDDN